MSCSRFCLRLVLLAVIIAAGSFFAGRQAFAATIDVAITSAGNFSPSSVTINTGDIVRWTNNSATNSQPSSDQHPQHNDYPDPTCSSDPANCWEAIIAPSATGSFTFQISGTWPYHDHLTPGKTGSITVTDTNTPPTVTNLAASATSSSTIYLSWTSPGDDQGTYVKWGTPGSFDIRYSTSVITEGTWGTATQATGEPAPQAAGASQNMTVTGLQPSTLYYFALKTNDNNAALTSAISNSPSATSLASGAAPVAPADSKTPLFSDTQRPNAPTNITAVVGDRFVTFTWVNPLDSDFSSIRLYRSEEKGKIGTIAADTIKGLTYTDRDLTNGITYYYTVKALDTPAGNESSNTEQVVGTPTGAAFVAETSFQVTQESGGDMTLTENGIALVSISVPPLVLENPLALSAYAFAHDVVLPGMPLPVELQLIGTRIFDLTLDTASTPSSFAAQLDFFYTDALLADINERALRIATYDEEGKVWYVLEDAEGDLEANRMIVFVTHLSRFALVVPADAHPSSPPGETQATVEELGAVVLSWKNPEETDHHHVRIYRSITGEDPWFLVSGDARGTSFRDTTANASAYTYRLVSVDRSGNVSTDAALLSVAAPSLSPVHHDISEGALVRVEGTPEVYIVAKRSGFTLIRHLLDPDVPAFYGHLGPAFWDLVQTVQTLGSSRIVSFIRCPLCLNGGKVFEVNDDGTRHHLAMTWEEFTFRLGNDAAFAQVAVFEVNEQELNHYAEGEVVLP